MRLLTPHLLLSLCLLLIVSTKSTEAFVGLRDDFTATNLQAKAGIGLHVRRRAYERPQTNCVHLAISRDRDDAPCPASRRSIFRNFPLQRPYERVLFLFYTSAGMAPYLTQTPSTATQAATCLVWASFILAISFMEAWVKFRAPFLRKHVAVDVGRHVFAALNAVELGLATSIWLGRVLVNSLGSAAANISLTCLKVATAILLLEAFYISPKLFVRAKAQIVKGISTADRHSTEEENAFRRIQSEIMNIDQLPSSKWHFIYVLLELIKVVCLTLFVKTVAGT